MFSRTIAALMIISTILAGGCSHSREIDQVAYVISLGIDATPDGQMSITYRIANPTALDGTLGGGGEKKETSHLVTIVASSLTEGKNLLNSSQSRAVNMTQVKAFVIGEDFARRGMETFIATVMRDREYRGSTFLFVTHGAARDLMKNNKPEIDILPSRWVENIVETNDESSFYIPVTLHDFYKRLKGGSGSPHATAFGLNPLSGADQPEKPPPSPDNKSNEYLAAGIPRQGGNPATFIGAAVFRQDKLAGFLTDKQTRSLAMLTGWFSRCPVSLADPLSPEQNIHVEIRMNNHPDIQVDCSGPVPRINVKAFLEGELLGIDSGIFYESPQYTPILEQGISRAFTAQLQELLDITRHWGCDAANFSYHARRRFATLEEFDAYQWDSKYPQADIQLEIKTVVRRNGLMRKTIPIRRGGE